MLRKPAGRRGQSGAGALALRLGEAGTVEAARGGRAWQRGESHPWTEGRKGHAERQEVQQAADHGGEHGNALQRRAPDGGVVPVMRAGDHEALQGIMMLRRKAPELGKRGSGHQGREYTPGPGRVGLERANERGCAAGARGIGCVGAKLCDQFLGLRFPERGRAPGGAWQEDPHLPLLRNGSLLSHFAGEGLRLRRRLRPSTCLPRKGAARLGYGNVGCGFGHRRGARGVADLAR